MGARRCLSVRRQGLSLGLSSPLSGGYKRAPRAVVLRPGLVARVGPYQPAHLRRDGSRELVRHVHVPLRHRGIRPTHDLHDGRRDSGCCLPPLPGPVLGLLGRPRRHRPDPRPPPLCGGRPPHSAGQEPPTNTRQPPTKQWPLEVATAYAASWLSIESPGGNPPGDSTGATVRNLLGVGCAGDGSWRGVPGVRRGGTGRRPPLGAESGGGGPPLAPS